MRKRLPRWTGYRSVETWSSDIQERWRRVNERIALYARILKEEAR